MRAYIYICLYEEDVQKIYFTNENDFCGKHKNFCLSLGLFLMIKSPPVSCRFTVFHGTGFEMPLFLMF